MADAQPEPTEERNKTNRGCLVVVLVLVGAFVVAMIAGVGSGSSGQSNKIEAQDMCHKFVDRQLRAPATSRFESYEDAVITGTDPTYTVSGHVDAQNGFGALIRSSYQCTVTHDGDNWHLVSLSGLG